MASLLFFLVTMAITSMEMVVLLIVQLKKVGLAQIRTPARLQYAHLQII